MLFWETKSSDDNWQKSVLMYKHFDSSSEARGWWINNVTDIHSYPLSCPSNTCHSDWMDLIFCESVWKCRRRDVGVFWDWQRSKNSADGRGFTPRVHYRDDVGAGVWYISINSSDDWRLCLFRMFKNLKETLTWERDVQDKVLEAFQVFYK